MRSFLRRTLKVSGVVVIALALYDAAGLLESVSLLDKLIGPQAWFISVAFLLVGFGLNNAQHAIRRKSAKDVGIEIEGQRYKSF